jgi:hypothetical protein
MSQIADYKRRGATTYSSGTIPEFSERANQGALIENRFGNKWAQIFASLAEIRKLQSDWDGEGSAAPGPEVTDGAISFALSRAHCGYPPPDCVAPGVNGTIYFEWHTPAGYCEVEVYSPCFVEQRFVPEGTNEVKVARFPTGDCSPGYEF